MHHLRTVYSTLDNPPSLLSFIMGCVVFGLIVCFCIAMYIGKGRNTVTTLRSGGKVNAYLAALPFVIFVFAVFLGIAHMNINVYQHDKALLDSNNKELKIVEGTIKNYYPEPSNGHGDEEFTVQDTLFHYSHFEEGRSGYNKTRLHGGIIRKNLYVRITYYYDGDRNAILKLETE